MIYCIENSIIPEIYKIPFYEFLNFLTIESKDTSKFFAQQKFTTTQILDAFLWCLSYVKNVFQLNVDISLIDNFPFDADLIFDCE